MKKIMIVLFVMIGMTLAAQAQSPIISLGKAIGELAVAPVGIAVGVVEGVADGVCESVEYLVTGQTSTKTTTITTTTYTPTTAPVYVIPSQTKTAEKNNVVINNSPNATVTINEVKTTTSTTKTPTVIYVPSRRPNYYYYNPYHYIYP